MNDLELTCLATLMFAGVAAYNVGLIYLFYQLYLWVI